MTGKRGFSGKPPTPEARQAKRAAAIMGGNAKAGRAPRPDPDQIDGVPEHSDALLAAFPELAGYPFPVPDSLALKDALEATLKQAKALQAEVELDEAKAKLALTSGRQVLRSELRRILAATRDIWWSSVQQVSSESLAALASLPLEHRAAIKSAIDAAVVRCAERVREHMKPIE